MNKDEHYYKNKKAGNDRFLFFTPANGMNKSIKYIYDPEQLEQIKLREIANKKLQWQQINNDRVFFSCLEYEIDLDITIAILFKFIQEKLRLKKLADRLGKRRDEQKQILSYYHEMLLLYQLNGFFTLVCK